MAQVLLHGEAAEEFESLRAPLSHLAPHGAREAADGDAALLAGTGKTKVGYDWR